MYDDLYASDEQVSPAEQYGVEVARRRATNAALAESAARSDGYGPSSAGDGYQPNTKATNAALIESAMKTDGYGASSAGEGGANNAASSSSGTNWAAIGSMVAKSANADKGKPSLGDVNLPSYQLISTEPEGTAATMSQNYIVSDKTKKRGVSRGAGQALARGAARTDPISANGVDMLRIQELSARVAKLRKAIAALKPRKRSKS